MITFWNRVEVYMGFSMNDFNSARSRLRSNNIKYKYRIHSKDSTLFGPSNRGRYGSFGQSPGFDKTYYLYVHKDDEGIAHKAINSK